MNPNLFPNLKREDLKVITSAKEGYKMAIVGLTGGIATGKSLVSNYLKELDAYIIDYDVISRMVVEPGLPAWQDIVDYFGKDILKKDQTLDRVKLGKIVFNDEAKRKKLESFIYSRMFEYIEEREKAALSEDANAIVIHDVPLLFETGVDKHVEKVIVVYASEETQLNRLWQRDGMSEEDGRSRIRAQYPLAEKVKRADFVIYNDGSIEETKRQIEEVYHILRSLAQK
jgi:dephospho-CoA kinase